MPARATLLPTAPVIVKPRRVLASVKISPELTAAPVEVPVESAPKAPTPAKERVPEVVEHLSGLVTSAFLEKMFNRKGLTIMIWRQREGLPYVRITGDGRDTIRFRYEAVLAWATVTGKAVVAHDPPPKE